MREESCILASWCLSPIRRNSVLEVLRASGYSGVCFEIKFSGRHRGFDGVLFNLLPLANTEFRDAQC